MDTRNGNIYPSRELAEAAGVPDEHLVEIEPEVVRVTSGPFKGRVYKRTSSGLERVDEGRRGVFKNDGSGRLVKVRP